MRRFFEWKHDDNPFGRSPAWVATIEGRIIGFRTFLRWELTDGERRVRAVRAVDTATHPAAQGRGVFRSLTLHALDELAAEGVEVVFNTPNDQSRPGYLKMGWQLAGRLPIAIRPRTVASLVRVARSRVAADRWSVPVDAGAPADEVLADHQAVSELLTGRAVTGLTTAHRPDTLAWRYGGGGGIHYRAVLVGDHVTDGLLLVRVRRRGAMSEATLAEAIVPPSRRSAARRALGRFLAASKADVVVADRVTGRGLGTVPLPKQGPWLTVRSTTGADPPPVGLRSLTLGDVELF